MADIITKQQRRITMQAIKSKNTKIEVKVSKELWSGGFRFRKNVKSLKGKPDIAIKKYKVVIFLDSCFWHGCKEHCRYPLTNKDYWHSKISKNIKRDREVTDYYLRNNWNILRVWEHDLKNNFNKTIRKIKKFVLYSKKISTQIIF